MEDKQKLTEIEAKEGDGTIAECSDYYVPYGVTSFGDLQTYRAAQETAGEVRELFSDFQQIASNIMSSQTIENKADAIIALTTEFIGMLTPGSETEETEIASSEIAEAATLKSHAKSAIKALEGLLSEKKLPKKLMGQIEEMKAALNKTWKDLGDEADGEEDEEMPDTEKEACKKKDKVKESFSESYAGVMGVVELSEKSESSLLEMDVQLIRPGWGNAKDSHWYGSEMLKTYAERFVGAKMYETDHKQAEKNNRTYVSQIIEIKGFADDGAPIARVAVYDPGFAEKARNMADFDKKNPDSKVKALESLECSILADGTARPGEVEGRKGKIVESITDVKSVDWVTRAGAGGHALSLAESDTGGSMEEGQIVETESATIPEPVAEAGEQSTQPTRLNEAQVQEMLAKSKLPEASKERLCEGDYLDEAMLQEAVTKEIAYVKKITGSGQPFGMGNTQAPQAEKLSEAEIEIRKNGVMKKYGLGG